MLTQLLLESITHQHGHSNKNVAAKYIAIFRLALIFPKFERIQFTSFVRVFNANIGSTFKSLCERERH